MFNKRLASTIALAVAVAIPSISYGVEQAKPSSGKTAAASKSALDQANAEAIRGSLIEAGQPIPNEYPTRGN